jgi:hypothetical protein
LSKKASVFAEIKGEEYKSEDLLKEQYKIMTKIANQLSLKDKTMLVIYAGMEQAAGYLRVMRADKVNKFYKECLTELE